MIIIEDKKYCCGCAACAQICPKNCIIMREDEEGFLYPEVDHSNCINCGLCEKKCPVLQNKNQKNDRKEPIIFVTYQKDLEIRIDSSSGGLFSSFASKIIQQGGVVYGVAFDENFLVHHVSADNLEQLEALRGSKYLQSRIENTFIEVKELLQNGKSVLYTGTACQIAGLKNYLGKEYDTLYTIDVLCHGVPSPKLWKHYLKEQEKLYEGKVKKVIFRNKEYGWKNYSILIEFDNNKTYKNVFTKDAFMELFLNNICLRPSCHACEFKGMNRPSDITLGDCWGVEKYMPEMDDDKGTSIMLVHTEKGQRLLDSIKDELYIKNAELDNALPPNADSRKSVFPHQKRKTFFKMLNKGKSINNLIKLLKPSLYIKCRRLLRKIKRKISV